MNTREQHGESERREGLGGRVRRFVDDELHRVLDKEDRDTPGPASYPVTVTSHPATAGPHDVTTGPHDAGYETPVSETPVSETPVSETPASETPAYEAPAPKEAGPGQFRDRSHDEAAADGSAERVGLLNNPAGLRDQWQRVQGTFVDDPQRAVQEASVLVERTLREIQENVARGQVSDPTSTEDLRVSFQRYREFFQRLLSA
ncbi:MAG: hypothetical protein ACRDQ4_05365 [Pseudonocardiaceae bacterium]